MNSNASELAKEVRGAFGVWPEVTVSAGQTGDQHPEWRVSIPTYGEGIEENGMGPPIFSRTAASIEGALQAVLTNRARAKALP
jgi:hypothetical protein